MRPNNSILTAFIGLLALLSISCATSLPATQSVLANEGAALQESGQPTSVILFICDGCGPAAYTLARDYQRFRSGREFLTIDPFQVGSVHTYSTSSRVTDSAAGATALAAGVKTYNGAISVDTLRQPVATVLEGAQTLGKATGLVTNTRITHATPAAFAAHVEHRREENEIALQLVASNVDLLFGGGRRHFLPRGQEGGAREDGQDLLTALRGEGYDVVTDRGGFERADALPVAGLFTNYNLAYEVDRPESEPSLAELTRKAIDLLSQGPNGFFLMVEAGRVDHGEHDNDLAAAAHDMLAYDEAVAAALEFAQRDARTLIVATSDHETGGLTLGRNVGGRSVYSWEPAVLDRIRASHDVMADRFLEGTESAEQVLQALTGLGDVIESERTVLDAADEARSGMRAAEEGDAAEQADALEDEAEELFRRGVAAVVSRHAITGWTSLGHTAVDVPLFAFGPGSDQFVGHFDNTHVGKTIARLLQVDLESLTARLRARADAAQ